MPEPLKLVTIGTPCVIAPQGIVKSFVYSGKGSAIVDKVCGFGNAGTPIPTRNITLGNNNLLQITLQFFAGILDDKPPTITLKQGLETKLTMTVGFFPDNFVVGGLAAGIYVIETDMTNIVDGGVGYSMSSFEGGIS